MPNTPVSGATPQTNHDHSPTPSIPTPTSEHNNTPTPSPQTSPIAPLIPPLPTRTSTRTKSVPNSLKDFHYTLPPSLVNSIKSKHHHSKYINYHNIHSPKHRNLINIINKTVEPHSYTQAAKHLRWVDAMNKELHALETNNTWVVVTLPAGKTSIGSK